MTVAQLRLNLLNTYTSQCRVCFMRTQHIGEPRAGQLQWRAYLILAAVLLLLVGCSDGSSSPPPMSAGRALVVGDADGAVLQEIRAQYSTSTGSGAEDPEPFDVIVFDGAETTPDELLANPGPGNFLRAGKPLVVLNNTEAHRSQGLGNLLWAHAEGSSPAVAFLIRQDGDGVPQETVQLNFPLRMEASPSDDADSTQTAASDAELNADSKQWLASLQDLVRGELGSIGPASASPGQAVLSFDDVTPAMVRQHTVLTNQNPPMFTSWGPNGDEPPVFSATTNVAFETRLYALLEGNSASSFQHKIIARQYLLVSPPNPLATSNVTTQFASVGSNWSGSAPVYSTIGFSTDFDLILQLVNGGPLGVVESLPEAANGVTQLTTSQSHTEMVSLSATFGIQNGNPLGTISAAWSQSWTWAQTMSVSFSDWESRSSVSNNEASYRFRAVGGTQMGPDELMANLLELPLNSEQVESQSQTPFFYDPSATPPGLPELNQLQTSAMSNQSETVWLTTSGGELVPPQIVHLVSSAIINSGELLDVVPGIFNVTEPLIKLFTGRGTTLLHQAYDLDFGAASLRPPAPAPWTIAFDEPSPDGRNWMAAGSITLNAAQSTPTTLSITYVVEPEQAILTLPSADVCPGNTTSFNPSPEVVSNAPLSLTIPAGETNVDLAPRFESIGEPYNVQVIAWQYSATVDGTTVLNPQAAACITIPE
jgi:hypothetical protein